MTNTINFNRITESLLEQTMDDIFERFFELEKFLDHSDMHIKEWVVIKLVTIIEQFCREIIKDQLKHNHDVHYPEKLQINIGDLERAKNIEIDSLIISQYNFQNTHAIINDLRHYKINDFLDKETKDDLDELFNVRHNIVHTISSQNYDVRKGYDTTQNLLKHILDKSSYGLIYYDITNGLHFADMENYDESMNCFIRVVETNPTNVVGHYYIGLLHCIMNNPKDAYDRSTTIIHLEPKNPNGYHLKGLAFVEQKKYNDAIICFNKSIKLAPRNVNSYYHKCKTLLILNKNDEAILSGYAAIDIDPTFADIVIIVVRALIKMHKYRVSLELLNEEIIRHPNNADAYYEKYVVLYKLSKNDESKQCFDNALRLNPKGKYPTISSNDEKENVLD